MTRTTRGLAVAALQVALVLSVAGKYAWERQRCPNVWARAAQYDPETPLRGRYLALQLKANACGLNRSGHENRNDTASAREPNQLVSTSWEVTPAVREGKLVGVPVEGRAPDETETLSFMGDERCEDAHFAGSVDFFISEKTKTPFPLEKGQELWALVTVPPQGPPRPVKLAISDSTGFHPLDLR